MKEQPVNDALLRKFLLGEIDEETRQQIESRFITDHLFREKVLAFEDDLVEDYLEDGLAAEERERFVSRYADTSARRQQLRIVKSIKQYAIANTAENPTGISTGSRPSISLSKLRLRPIFLIPIAAILIIAFSIAAVLLNNRRERNRHHLAVEQQLARLNNPSSEVPQQKVSLVLPPGSVRTAGPQTELKPPADTQIVELRLLWIQKEHYATYHAALHRVGNAEQFTIRNLHADNDGKAIPLRIPTEVLTPGLYQISLRGIGSDDTPSPTEEYALSFSGPE
ncbi:MAG TPA: hypothetical protein VN643_10440 [Pyrinomonadaceae bacterium]|nr:hypothetical protein [Pyrinomonadaceae bacterium]